MTDTLLVLAIVMIPVGLAFFLGHAVGMAQGRHQAYKRVALDADRALAVIRREPRGVVHEAAADAVEHATANARRIAAYPWWLA